MFSNLTQFKDLRTHAKLGHSVLKAVVVHADADHGKVQVVMDGNQQVMGLEIDPDHLRAEKREELQKHVAEAVNSAIRKSQVEAAKILKQTPGLNLPGGLG
jgi:DNA-binding protein YbaB